MTPGRKIGEYEIKALLGAAGMGEDCRVLDVRLGCDVAFKVLLGLLSEDRDRQHRFEQEARAAAALNHPTILAVLQMGTFERVPYLVSELREGETMREQLQRTLADSNVKWGWLEGNQFINDKEWGILAQMEKGNETFQFYGPGILSRFQYGNQPLQYLLYNEREIRDFYQDFIAPTNSQFDIIKSASDPLMWNR
jgi:serine/threonine protein kinase